MEFELGQTYAGYEILQLVRSSRSAHEYRVRNVFAQREETLKVLPSAAQENREIADSFLREARILARVSHPNIVTFFNAQPIDGRMVMTTEFIGVEPLSARLLSGAMPWREALDAAGQLLSAVACLHESNIVHLDITPASVVCQGGVWKLANFEKARVVNGVPLTGNGAVSGNVKYISPEQVKGGTLDRRSDIYSLATVLYEMLCGRTPFDSNSQFELMLAHVSAIPAPPSEFCKELPEGLDNVVLRALAKEPANRPDAPSFAAELKEIAAKTAVAPVALPEVPVEALLPVAVEEVAVAEAEVPVEAHSPVAEMEAPVEAQAHVAVEEVAVAEAEAVVEAHSPAAELEAPVEAQAHVAVEEVAVAEAEAVIQADSPAAELEAPVEAQAHVAVEQAAVAEAEGVVEAHSPAAELEAPVEAQAHMAVEEVAVAEAEAVVEAHSPAAELEAPVEAQAHVAVEEVAVAEAEAVVEAQAHVAVEEVVVAEAEAEVVVDAHSPLAEHEVPVEADSAVAAQEPVLTELEAPAEALAQVVVEEPAVTETEAPVEAHLPAAPVEAAIEAQSAAAVEEPAFTDVETPVEVHSPDSVPTDMAGLAALAIAVTQMVRESEALPPIAALQRTADVSPEKVEHQPEAPAIADAVPDPIQTEPMLFDVADDTPDAALPAEAEPAPHGLIEAVAELMPDAVESRPSRTATLEAIESVPVLLGPGGVEPTVPDQPLAEVVSEASAPKAPAGPDPTLQANLWAAAAMVSKAAEVAPPPHTEPVSVVQVVPTAAAAAATAAAAAAASADNAPTATSEPGYSVPAEIAAARQPDITHWIMLGSAAAFLFIVWIAIYFGFRW